LKSRRTEAAGRIWTCMLDVDIVGLLMPPVKDPRGERAWEAEVWRTPLGCLFCPQARLGMSCVQQEGTSGIETIPTLMHDIASEVMATLQIASFHWYINHQRLLPKPSTSHLVTVPRYRPTV
jgi:hypothetical protein